MRVVVNSTEEIVTVNGVKARVWHGVSAEGLHVVMMVSSIGIMHQSGSPDMTEVDVPHESLTIRSADGKELYYGE
jgi:hypothetical protein